MRASSFFVSIALVCAASLTTVFGQISYKYSGNLCVHSPGKSTGYVSASLTNGLYTLVHSKVSALNASLVKPHPGPYSIQDTTAPIPRVDLVQFVLGPNSFNKGNLSPTSDQFVYMCAGPDYTYPGAQPVLLVNTVTPGQTILGATAVWSYETGSPHKLTPTWPNLNGHTDYSQILFYNPTLEYFGLTGDLAAYKKIGHSTASAYSVTFELCDLSGPSSF